MNTIHLRIVIAFAITILLGGCRSDPVTTDARAPGLYATVVDSAGNRISGVAVHYIFYWTTGELPPDVTQPWIQYWVSTPRLVSLRIYDPFGLEAAVLIDSLMQPAGQHSIMFDGRGFTNGIYSYKVFAGDSVQAGFFYLLDVDLVPLVQKPPLVTSDENGIFFLSPSTLGIGKRFSRDLIGGSPIEMTVGDSITVVLYKHGFQHKLDSFKMGRDRIIDRKFVIGR